MGSLMRFSSGATHLNLELCINNGMTTHRDNTMAMMCPVICDMRSTLFRAIFRGISPEFST